MDGETTYFVLSALAQQIGESGEPISFSYALVQIPQDKIEKALLMQDEIDRTSENQDELKEQKKQNFGGEVRDEISKLEGKILGMKKEKNNYLGSNAISYLSVVERGQQTFFEGDGIASSALEKMLDEKILEIGVEKEMQNLV